MTFSFKIYNGLELMRGKISVPCADMFRLKISDTTVLSTVSTEVATVMN